MRIIGEQNRSEIELDPVAAYRRGRKLDAMLRAATPTVLPGVTRGAHGGNGSTHQWRDVA